MNNEENKEYIIQNMLSNISCLKISNHFINNEVLDRGDFNKITIEAMIEANETYKKTFGFIN